MEGVFLAVMELNHDITGSYSFQRCIGCEYFGSRDILVYDFVVNEYSKVKVEAAKLYPEDIDKYIEHKASVIKKIYSVM